MAALQAMACGEDGRALLAPILCRERTALLSEIITNAFVEKSAATLADSFATVAAGWYDTLLTTLTPTAYPTVRR